MEEIDTDILDEIGALVVVLDEDGRIVHWNDACSRLTGYELDEVRGRAVWDFLLVSDEADAVREEFEQSRETDSISRFENYWLTRDGERRWISWTNRPMESADIDSNYVVATGVDRTDAREARDALELATTKFRSILSLAPDAVVVLDDDRRIELYNEGAERLFGWRRADVVGEPIDILFPDSLPDEKIAQLFPDDGDGGEGSSPFVSLQARRHGGDEFPAEAAVSRVDVADETLFTVIVRDMTERRNLEESLRREIERRRKLMRGIVHDLRNPLNTISLQSQLLERLDDDLGDDLKKPVDQIREAADMIERLLDDLLDSASPHVDELSVRTRPLDPGELVREAVARFEPRARRAGVDLDWDLPEPLPDIQADRTRLMQVLDNLIENALKFTTEESAVRVAARPAGEVVVVTVRDEGPGMDDDELEHLFDPLWQGDPEDRRGVGLGMAIARSIVESHGGEIEAESQPDEGTSVRFTVPVAS